MITWWCGWESGRCRTGIYGSALGAVFTAAILLSSSVAWGTHEVDHRFVISGTVRHADGTPRADVKVVATHPRSQLTETVFADRNGFYSVLLHLHDQDAGDTVTVTAGDETKTIKADFSPEDHRTPRVTRVDFGPVVAETSTPVWWYGIGGGAVVVGGFVYWRMRHKGRRGRAKTGRHPSKTRGKS